MFPLSFAFPWILAVLAGLPLLWRILRTAPPPPRMVRFPGIFFLQGLHTRQETPGRTPLWLVLLRTVLISVLVLAASGPMWRDRHAAPPADRPLLLLLDTSAVALPGWQEMLAATDTLLASAFRAGRPVFWVALAPQADGTLASGALGSTDWQRLRTTLLPKAWLADIQAASRAVTALPLPAAPEIWLVSSGLLPRPFADGWLQDIVRRTGGQATVLLPASSVTPRHALTGLVWDGDRATATIAAFGAAFGKADATAHARNRTTALPPTVQFLTLQGEVLATATATTSSKAINANTGTMTASLRLPPAQATQVRQARLVGDNTLAALWLAGGGWGAPPLGLLSDKPASQTTSLLDELHYIRQASQLHHRTVTGPLAVLLAADSRVILWPDAVVPDAASRKKLLAFVASGGVLVRFAGDTLASLENTSTGYTGPSNTRTAHTRTGDAAGGTSDPLLPVQLRPGKRALGGTLGEAVPHLRAFAPHTPLTGLAVPGDVKIQTLVLPEPLSALPERVWATLSDGTPLVTARREGRGWLVLVHTTATPLWGNLVYSGVFPDMIGRFAALAQATGGTFSTASSSAAALLPWKVLDARGQLNAPPPHVMALPADRAALLQPGPRQPPGLYGSGGQVALNLGPDAAERLTPVQDVWDGPLQTAIVPEQALAPPLLMGALVLLILDMLATLHVQTGGGLWRRSVWRRSRLRVGAARMTAAAILVTGLVLAGQGAVSPVLAQDSAVFDPSAVTRPATTEALDFLGFLASGDSTVDQVAAAGLAGLTRVVTARTAAELAPPRQLRADDPDLPLAVLLYWPLGAQPPHLTDAELQGLRTYLQGGGLLFLDTRSATSPATQAAQLRTIQVLLQDLGVAPVAPLPEDHVLHRTFYLLQRFPGRWTAGTLAIPPLPEDRADAVVPVIVGSNDYAAAWAVNAAGNLLLPGLPQGVVQREQALRTGVNLVLYALTGTYKNDQIHLKAILERME
jgi:Domain of unknown function (DUF4159)/Aerotolerance regulator N-terminal